MTDATGEESTRPHFTKSLWFLGVIALAMALLLKTFLLQAFFIPSESMEKTLHGCDGCTGDRVLVNKLVYKFREPHRGEIVVFSGKGTRFGKIPVEPPHNAIQRLARNVQGALGLGSANDSDYIKRVIGVPGDVVACCVNGHVTVNGAELVEPYVNLEGTPIADFGPVVVPKGRLFVMGDNRHHSADSRVNDTIPIGNVIGRAFAVFYPLSRAKRLPVPPPFAAAFVVLRRRDGLVTT
jgi:signal peptidase I